MNIRYYVMAILLGTSFCGCSDDDDKDIPAGDKFMPVFSGTIGGFGSEWQGQETGRADSMRVYAVKDGRVIVADELYVPRTTGEVADFVCTGQLPMLLKDADEYTFYSCRARDNVSLSGSDGFYVKLGCIQEQRKAGDMQHVRKNDFIHAKARREGDKVHFEYEHAFALLEFVLPAGVKGISLNDTRGSGDYAGDGSFSLKEGNWNTREGKAPLVNLILEEPTTREGDKAWMLVLPGHEGEFFDLLVQTEGFIVYRSRREVPEGGFLAGHKYVVEFDKADADEVLTPPVQTGGVWQLSSLRDVRWFRDNVNCGAAGLNARLLADVDLEGSEQNPWWPIGLSEPYAGEFDGNGYTISGLYVRDIKYDSGLWSEVDAPARIANLEVAGQIAGNDNNGVGGIVASNYGGTVENCHSKVNIRLQYGRNIGGVVGYSEGVIRDCYYSGDIRVEGGSYVGGVFCNNFGVVENCYNAGTFSLGCVFIGGVGCLNASGAVVRNCAALCAEWKDVGGVHNDVLGRVVAIDYGESYNNIAYEGIVLNNVRLDKENLQGRTRDKAACLDPVTYAGELGWSPDTWGFAGDGLPYLKVLRDVTGRVPAFRE